MATSEEIRLIIKAEIDKATKDLKSFTAELAASDKQSKTTSSSLAKTAIAYIGVGAAVSGAIQLLKESVKAASDLEETTSKFNVTFSGVGDQAELVAKRLVDVYGLSTNQSKSLLAATGDLLTGFGFTAEAALKYSQQVNELAVDLASFQNLQGGVEQASQALTRSMTGERESLKTLGIVVNEELIAEKLFAQGKQNLTGMALMQAKAEITVQEAIKQSKNAVGDAVRTQDSYANVMRRVQSTLEDAKAAMGKDLMDALAGLGQTFLILAKDGGFIADTFKSITKSIADSVLSLNNFVKAVNSTNFTDFINFMGGASSRTRDLKKAVDEVKLKKLKDELNELIAIERDDLTVGVDIQANLDRQAELRAQIGLIEYQQGQISTRTTQTVVQNNQQQLTSTENLNKAQLEAAKKMQDDYWTFISSDYENQVRKEMEHAQTMLASAQFTADQKLEIERSLKQKIAILKNDYDAKDRARSMESFNLVLANTQTVLGSIQAAWQQHTLNVSIELANEQLKVNETLEAINAGYRDTLQKIDNDYKISKQKIISYYDELIRKAKKAGQDTIALEKAKDEALIKLDEDTAKQKSDIEKKQKEENDKINDAFEKKKRKIARENAITEKKIAIAAATINIAQGITKAYAQGGMLGFVTGALIATAGAIQLALIARQPLPEAQEGALVRGTGQGTVVRVGENNRPEAIVPLSGDRNLGGIGGTTVNLNIQNLYASEDLPKRLVEQIDRELTKLHQDRNSTFAASIQ